MTTISKSSMGTPNDRLRYPWERRRPAGKGSAMPPAIVLIAALARNRVIGAGNTLPWRLPEDMRFFRETTFGHAVLMGRRTWQSLKKPLDQRLNLVLSRDANLGLEGGTVVADLDEALDHAGRYAPDRPLYVIGGGQVYRLALPRADRLILTEIDADFDGDVFFPEFSTDEWQQVLRTPGIRTDAESPHFDHVVYERCQAGLNKPCSGKM